MRLVIPGLYFLTSSIQLKFDTDGYVTLFEPTISHFFDPENILVLTKLHIQIFGLRSVAGVSLFDTIVIPDDFKIPEVHDGTQGLVAKSILILMLNGWGDMILIQPALRAFCEKAISSGDTYCGLPFSHWDQSVIQGKNPQWAMLGNALRVR